MSDHKRELAAALDPIEVALSGIDYVAETLAPLVELLCAEAAAAALHEAAVEQDAEVEQLSMTKGTHRGGHDCAAHMLRGRALAVIDALNPTP